MTTITGEQRDHFEREGYLVLESVDVPAGTLDAIVQSLDGLFEAPQRVEDGVSYGAHRIRNAWRNDPNVKALALAPNVLSALGELYGRKAIGWQTLNFRSGTQQEPHSDTLHFNSKPPGFMAGVWVALEDIDMDNGPVVYYPGSHRLPELTMQDFGLRPDFGDYEQYEQRLAEVIEREGLEPRYATIPKGHALVWAANLIHGGAKQSDPARTRRSQVTHYFFEGCQIWQPMTTEGDQVHWLEFEPIE